MNAITPDADPAELRAGAIALGEPARTVEQQRRAEAPSFTMTAEAFVAIVKAGRALQAACFAASQAGGWHNDPDTGKPRTAAQNDALFPTRIALCHSELSEALEGHRCNRMDDKLPHRRQAEVELADELARVFDTGASMDYDLGHALAEKLAFNLARLDHKPEARRAAGGKRY